MALSYKARRRWALVILLIGLPIYIIFVINVVALLGDLPKWLQFFVFVFLGIAWVFPLKSIFKGIGQPDPDA